MAFDKVIDSAQLDADLTSVADAIRERAGTSGKLDFPSGMVSAVPSVFTAGEEAERKRCVAKHYAEVFYGNGQTSVSFHVPFEPDFIAVLCSDSDVYKESSGVVYSATFDLASFGFIAGVGYTSTANGIVGQLMTSISVLNRYSRSADGTVTLQNIGSTAGLFFSGRPYFVVAIKYIEKTDKERITEYIQSLGDSGSATLNKAKIDAAFTAEEWSALIATKPNWTFAYL